MSDQVEAIAQVIGVRRVGRSRKLTWFGEPLVDLDESEAVEHLAALLYSSAYTRGQPVPYEPREEQTDPTWRDLPFDDRLQARWSGWTRTSSGHLQRDGEPRLVDPAATAGPVEPSVAPVSDEVMPGWVVIRHGDICRPGRTVRVYANTEAGAIRASVNALVDELLGVDLPQFTMKFLMSTAHADRADSTVIYVPEQDRLIERLAAVLTPTLAGASIPMFTYRLGPGVGLAHCRPDGESFGMVRCRQVAAAIVNQRRRNQLPVRVPFDRRAPWDDPRERALRRPSVGTVDLPRRSVGDPVAAVQALARRLDDEALSAGGLATWLVHDDLQRRWLATGADVYTGSAGPLLVLVHADRLAGDEKYLPLARAAARGMLARQHEIASRRGFHSGPAGTSAVLAEVALLSGDDELDSLARRSLVESARIARASRGWDILAGVAGTVVGLSAAGSILRVPVSEPVQELILELVASAEDDPRRGFARWRSPNGRRRPALAGLAHGGSGAALALGIASRSDDWTGLVVRSVAFEDECRADDRGWIDFRVPGFAPVALAWCHGAAGIGVASAALGLRHAVPFRQRASIAACRLRQSLEADDIDGGLCHGRAGRALALAVIGGVVGDTTARGDATAAFERLPLAPGPLDPTLMNGEPGIVLGALAVNGLAPPPLAFVLDVALHTGGD